MDTTINSSNSCRSKPLYGYIRMKSSTSGRKAHLNLSKNEKENRRFCHETSHKNIFVPIHLIHQNFNIFVGYAAMIIEDDFNDSIIQFTSANMIDE